MPRVYDIDDEIKNDGSSCGVIRDDLSDCILNDDCVKKDGKLPSECFRQQLLSEECMNLRTLLFECKRSLVSLAAAPDAWRVTTSSRSWRGAGVVRHTISNEGALIINFVFFSFSFLPSFLSCVLSSLFQLDNRVRFRGRKGYT